MNANTHTVDLNDTPIVTIDLDVMEANIARMQRACDDVGVGLRPHIKTHKIPEIARLQIEAGARGIACQKLGEVAVMQAAGLDDIFLTYNILGQAKLERLYEMASQGRLLTLCDNERVARGLSEGLQGLDYPLPVLVECDTGSGRNGTQTPDETAELALLVERLPNLRFAGLMTYPITESTASFLSEAYRSLDRVGLKAEIVSTGGTPAISLLERVPGATEHRAGTYVFNDRSCVAKGAATWDDCAMHIRATIVSRPTPDRAIIDAGSKALSADTLGLEGHGRIVEYPGALIYRLNEEHGYVKLAEGERKPEVGETIRIIPNHTCVVTNLHDELIGVRNGTAERVWPVAARGRIR